MSCHVAMVQDGHGPDHMPPAMPPTMHIAGPDHMPCSHAQATLPTPSTTTVAALGMPTTA